MPTAEQDMSMWITNRLKRPSTVALSGDTAAELLDGAREKFKEGFTAVVLLRYNDKEDAEDMPAELRKLFLNNRKVVFKPIPQG